MILVVSMESRRKLAFENPPVVSITRKQAGRHRRTWIDQGRVEQPATCPVWLQSLAGLQEVGRARALVVTSITGKVALQARCGFGCEELPPQIPLLICYSLQLYRYVGL